MFTLKQMIPTLAGEQFPLCWLMDAAPILFGPSHVGFSPGNFQKLGFGVWYVPVQIGQIDTTPKI